MGKEVLETNTMIGVYIVRVYLTCALHHVANELLTTTHVDLQYHKPKPSTIMAVSLRTKEHEAWRF